MNFKFEAKVISLIIVGVLCSEAHQLFNAPKYYHTVSWFIDAPLFPPYLSWYVYELGNILKNICWAFASYFIATKVNFRIAFIASTLVLYNIFDLILFFACFNQYGYTALYVSLVGWLVLVLSNTTIFDYWFNEINKSFRNIFVAGFRKTKPSK